MSAGVVQKEALKLDIGVATVAQPPKNFPPRDLLDGADRCLYASHASGGGVVKSIEIY
jgi:PleD family two-component response regulator